MRESYYFWLIGYYLFQEGSTLVVEFPSERELLFLVNWLLLFQGGSTLVVEFPSERELLFLVNWLLFVSGREHPSGGVSQ